jgi:PKHD-type hydroxylase
MIWFEPPSQLLGWEYSIPGVLDHEMVDSLNEYAVEHPLLQPAQVSDDNKHDDNVEQSYRRSEIMFLTDMEHFGKLYDVVINSVLEVNNIHFKYSLNHIEPLQYAVYRSENSGCYNIHTDSYLRNTSGFSRKVSFSILLDDPEDFEGGDLLLHTSDNPIKADMKKGDMFLFPSFVPHSVTPVTKGTRRALVGWVYGPNFV